MKKLFSIFWVCVFMFCCAPVCFAEEAASDAASSVAPVDQIATDAFGAVDQYGGGILDGADSVMDTWDEMISGISGVTNFFHASFTVLSDLVPAISFYFLLGAVLVVIYAIVHYLAS